MRRDPWKALADETRREILKLLKGRPHTAGEIADQFLLSAATVSHHLAVLKEAGLVGVDRRAQTLIYSIKVGALQPVLYTALELTAPEQRERRKK